MPAAEQPSRQAQVWLNIRRSAETHRLMTTKGSKAWSWLKLATVAMAFAWAPFVASLAVTIVTSLSGQTTSEVLTVGFLITAASLTLGAALVATRLDKPYSTRVIIASVNGVFCLLYSVGAITFFKTY